MERKQKISLSLILLLNLFASIGQSIRGPFAWRCTSENECWREIYVPDSGQMSLEKCKLTCGSYANLLPIPKSVNLAKETTPFLPNQITYKANNCAPNVCPLLEEAFSIMNASLQMYHPKHAKVADPWIGEHTEAIQNHTLKIELIVAGDEEYFTIKTDESYNLTIATNGNVTSAVIKANTFFGARHGLETLSQLIDYDVENNSLQIISNATIEDAPVFAFRGLNVDTSRNFISVEQLKKVLTGMAYNKLNTFHWHLTDTNSFPILIRALPNMTHYGAYSPDQVYSTEDVRDLVNYARVRGIRIIPEFDAPAHVGHGWEWGEGAGLGNLLACFAKKTWTDFGYQAPSGHLNIANPNIYIILEEIYKEFLDLFGPIDFFHYGGDEIIQNCWNTTREIVDWMTANNHGLDADAYYEQWGIFQEKARQLLTKSNKGVEIPGILWTSGLTEAKNADKYINNTHYVIQIWTNSTNPMIKDILTRGYQVIFSNTDALYLDCGTASWVGKGTNWCAPYKGWQDVYDNDIYAIAQNLTNSTKYHDQILGSEAQIWTEQIDDATLDSKLWPRASALAERLWSNPTFDYARAEYRILEQRHRLFQRGINAERLQPEWCRQNQGQCRDPNLPAPTYESNAVPETA